MVSRQEEITDRSPDNVSEIVNVAEDALDWSSTVSVADPSPGELVPSPGSQDTDELAPGTILGDYVIRSTIASGGGGSVFLADHPPSGKQCAVKVLHPELARCPVGLARFLREMSVVKLIQHPAIVAIHDAGELSDGRPYFAMELLQGGNLKQLIAERGRFSTEQALEILTPICSALSAAHAAGIVHRDIKASNVHATYRDGRCEIKLLDFGIAKLLAPEADKAGLTRAGTMLGTPATMAPEQIRGESVDERTDVYALGALLYHLLTGRPPFRAPSSQEIEFLILSAPPPAPSRLAPVSAAVDAVVLRCMEKAPAGRYPSAGAVEEAFRAAAASGTQASKPATARQAVGISISVRTGNLDDDEDGDRLFDDLTAVLDMAEETLREAGLANVLQTATTLLVARILSDDPGTAKAEVAAARQEALALSHRIATREEPHSGLCVEVRTHVASAAVSGGSAGQEIDGPIVDVASWPSDTVVVWTPSGG